MKPSSCSLLFVLQAVIGITLGVPASYSQLPQNQTNSLRLEGRGAGWQIRYSLAESNGAFRLVWHHKVETLLSMGKVLAVVGTNGSPRTGVVNVLTVSNSQAFFALVAGPPPMVWLEPGTFLMGSPPTEIGRGSDETQHSVTLTRGFFI